MDSRTLISNRVLIHLGISGNIQDYKEESREATIIRNNYDIARDYVLKDFDWGFASCYKELSLASKTEENSITGYLYEYHYPDNCISARSLYQKGDKVEKEFKTASNENGLPIILTNISPAVLRYTRRVENEVLFPAEFEMALSLYLAYLCAETLTGSSQKADRMLQKYDYTKRRSQKLNADEGRADDENNSTYLDERFF